jgi:DNA-binding MarR family transcriptional regulator
VTRTDPTDTMSLLVQVASGLAERTNDRLAAHGLTTVDLDVLTTVDLGPGAATMSDVAAGAGLTAGGATRVVDRLVGRGLVTREDCPDDRRVIRVALTAAGRTTLAAATAESRQVLETAIAGPLRHTGELAAFTAALHRLRDALTHTRPVPTGGPA